MPAAAAIRGCGSNVAATGVPGGAAEGLTCQARRQSHQKRTGLEGEGEQESDLAWRHLRGGQPQHTTAGCHGAHLLARSAC